MDGWVATQPSSCSGDFPPRLNDDCISAVSRFEAERGFVAMASGCCGYDPPSLRTSS